MILSGSTLNSRMAPFCRKLSWTIDMKGISEMYASYEALSYWPFLSAPTQGIRVDFVRAENSSYVWPTDDIERLKAYGHRVHHLSQAGEVVSVLRRSFWQFLRLEQKPLGV